MNSRSLAILLILLILGLAVWVLFPEANELDSALLGSGADSTSLEEANPENGISNETDANFAPDPSRSELVTSYPQWTTPPDRQHDLHGLVLGPDGQPFVGANVVAMRPAKQGAATLDLDRNRSSQIVAETISNLDGEFRIQLDFGSRYDLDVSAGGFYAPLLKGCQAGEKVIVHLEPSASVNGVITVKESGAPAAGVPMRLFRPGGVGRRMQTQTDEQGRYLFAGLTTGNWFLEASPPELLPPDWARLKVEAGQRLVQNFELQSGISATGRVIDAITHEPIVGAEVSNSWVFRRVSLTDAEGRYVLQGLQDYGGEFEINARAEGYGRLTRSCSADTENAEWDLELQPAHHVIGTLLLADGKPASGAYVAAVASTFKEGPQQIDWQSTHSAADGHFEIKNVRPDIAHALQVRMKGHGSLIYEFPPTEKTLNPIDLGAIYLPLAGWIAGRVHDENSNGVRGLELKLTGHNADRDKFGRPQDPELDHYLGTTSLRTDDLGRFRFPDLAEGTYTLNIKRAGMALIDPMELEVAFGKGNEGIEILIPIGEAIAGVVLGPNGDAFAGARVRLQSQRRGDGNSSSMNTNASGQFQFDGVIPGTYSVHASPPFNWSEQNDILLPVHLVDITPGQVDLSLTMKTGLTITGVVLDQAGDPVRQAGISATNQLGQQITSAFTDHEGNFSLRLPADEVVDLEIRPPYQLEDAGDGRKRWTPNQDPARAHQAAVPAGASGLIVRLPWEPKG